MNAYKPDEQTEAEDDSAEEHEELPGSELTHTEALQYILKLRNFARQATPSSLNARHRA